MPLYWIGGKLVRMQNFKSSTATVIELCFMKKKKMKNLFTCTSYLMWHFHPIVFMQLLFYMFSTLMSLEDRLKLKVKTKISLYMAVMLDHPWQSRTRVLCDNAGCTYIQCRG